MPGDRLGLRRHKPQIHAKVVIVLDPPAALVSDAKKDMPVGTAFTSVSGHDGPHTHDEALTVGESRRIELNAPMWRVMVRFLEPSNGKVSEGRFLSQRVVRKRQREGDAECESTSQGMEPLVEDDIHAHDCRSATILSIHLPASM